MSNIEDLRRQREENERREREERERADRRYQEERERRNRAHELWQEAQDRARQSAQDGLEESGYEGVMADLQDATGESFGRRRISSSGNWEEYPVHATEGDKWSWGHWETRTQEGNYYFTVTCNEGKRITVEGARSTTLRSGDVGAFDSAVARAFEHPAKEGWNKPDPNDPGVQWEGPGF